MGAIPEKPTLRLITDGNRGETDRCPWCGQPIAHEKFEEIRQRIEAEERKRVAEFERRLKDQVASEKANLQANARKSAEAAVKPPLAEAEKGRRAAEKQYETLRSGQ